MNNFKSKSKSSVLALSTNSKAINQLIDKALINKSWNPQSPIFLDPII